MYLLRRITKTQQGKAWDVANLMSKICAAYEENGRNKAQVFVSQGLPGTPTEAVRTLNAQMFPMLTEPWSIEFFELVTPQKLEERNLT